MPGKTWGPVSTYVDTIGAAVLTKVGDGLHLVARTLATILQGGLTLVVSAGHASVVDGHLHASFDLVLKDVPLPLGETASRLIFLADGALEPVEIVSGVKLGG